MEKITRLTICDRCGQEIKLLSNNNPEFLMTKLHIKKKWGVLDTNGNAGGIDDPNSFYNSARWYDSGAYSVTDDESDIIGMWEEPKLTTEELMEMAFNERLVLKHPLLPEGCKGFKVVGKTVSGSYILQDCDNYKMYFLHTFNENLEWSVKK